LSVELQLGDDAKRALREAENFCWRDNVAILTAEHLLAGALVVLARNGGEVPSALEEALRSTVGVGTVTLTDNVMFGPGARAAIQFALELAARRGQLSIGAADIAIGVIASEEVSPMFYTTLGVTADQLAARLL
jgi:hypothetical protein